MDHDIDLSSKMVELFKLPKDTPNRDKIMEAAAQHSYDKTQFQVTKYFLIKFKNNLKLDNTIFIDLLRFT